MAGSVSENVPGKVYRKLVVCIELLIDIMGELFVVVAHKKSRSEK